MVRIVTVTGASGAGKTTIVGAQLTWLSGITHLIKSTTTREPRPIDLVGEYEHLSLKEFMGLEETEDFLWTTTLGAHRYGTRKSFVSASLEAPKIGLMILVPEKVPLIKSYAPDAVYSFYIQSPPEHILRLRMQKRGDSAESIEKRIDQCRSWDADAKRSGVFDHFLFNNTMRDLKQAQMTVFNKLIEFGRHFPAPEKDNP